MKEGVGLRKREILDRIMLGLNGLALIGLIITYLSGVIGPSTYWPLAFVAMGYPIILVVTLLFVSYWAIRRKWFIFLNLAFLVVKWDYLTATINFTFPSNKEIEGIKVMTYNVRLFDRYNWSKDKTTKQRAKEFIFSQRPDILCIQEYYNQEGHRFRTAEAAIQLPFYHLLNYPVKAGSKDNLGLATLTKYPVIERGQVDFRNSNSALGIYTTILLEGDTVRIYNIHLQSIHLGNEGYAVIDELMETQNLEDVNRGKAVLSHMKKGFIRRAEQAEAVANHISSCRYKVIVCGDFNDVPTSFAYQTISKGLRDSFSQAGSGLGTTYVRVPFFRIDNILFSSDFEAVKHTVHPYELSDHLAVTAVLKPVN